MSYLGSYRTTCLFVCSLDRRSARILPDQQLGRGFLYSFQFKAAIGCRRAQLPEIHLKLRYQVSLLTEKHGYYVHKAQLMLHRRCALRHSAERSRLSGSSSEKEAQSSRMRRNGQDRQAVRQELAGHSLDRPAVYFPDTANASTRPDQSQLCHNAFGSISLCAPQIMSQSCIDCGKLAHRIYNSQIVPRRKNPRCLVNVEPIYVANHEIRP